MILYNHKREHKPIKKKKEVKKMTREKMMEILKALGDDVIVYERENELRLAIDEIIKDIENE